MNKSQLVIVCFGAIIGIATAIKPEEITGGLGEGRDFEAVKHEGMASANESAKCCEECAKIYPGTQLYTYIEEMDFCMCENPKNGNHLKTISYDGAFAGVCECVEDEDCNGGKCDANNICRDCLLDSDCANNGTCTSRNKCRPQRSEPQGEGQGQGDKPQALPLTVQNRGCNGDNHGIKCCPAYTAGDNKATGEKFVEENQYQGDCDDTCQRLYPDCTGVTESTTQKYDNGEFKCWCEFGPAELQPNQNYRTCVFIN